MKITSTYMHFTRAGRCVGLCSAIWILATAGLALAQRNTAAIFGTVTDASGGVVPGAVVDGQQRRHRRNPDDFD